MGSDNRDVFEKRKRPPVTPLQIIAVAIIIILAATTYLTYAETQTLSKNLNALNQSYVQLQLELNNQTLQLQDQRTQLGYWNQLLNTLLSNSSPSAPQPPTSKAQALLIALNYGGWNATSLTGKSVSIELDLYRFESSSDGFGIEFIRQVSESVANYSSWKVGDSTYRYVWTISITEPGVLGPPPGFYFVDAATGQIIPTGPPLL